MDQALRWLAGSLPSTVPVGGWPKAAKVLTCQSFCKASVPVETEIFDLAEWFLSTPSSACGVSAAGILWPAQRSFVLALCEYASSAGVCGSSAFF